MIVMVEDSAIVAFDGQFCTLHQHKGWQHIIGSCCLVGTKCFIMRPLTYVTIINGLVMPL
jgi:hypothetical protein